VYNIGTTYNIFLCEFVFCDCPTLSNLKAKSIRRSRLLIKINLGSEIACSKI